MADSSGVVSTFKLWLTWRPGGYLRASGVLFGWLMLRTVAQTTLFILVARSLGAEGYGALVAVIAVASFFTPLVSLGGQAIMVREASREPTALTEHLGDALRLWIWTALPFAAIAYGACRIIVPQALPAYAIASIVLADLVCVSLVDLLARAWQARQQMAGFGAVMGGLILARLGAFCILISFAAPNPSLWAVVYGAASGAYVVLAIGAAVKTFGLPAPSDIKIRTLARVGFPFAFAGSAMRIQAEANKPILARLDTMAGVGLFSAAQRVTDLVILPLAALLETLLPRAYRSANPLGSVWRLGSAPLALALVGGGLLIVAAPWLPWLLGSSFSDSVAVIRLLAFLPVLFVMRSLLSVAIATVDGQRHFLLAYGVGAVVGVIANMIWVPLYGLPGAAYSAYLTEIVMIGLQGALLVRYR